MKAAITNGEGKVWIEDLPAPVPNEYQCLCKNIVCATCTGTDRKHIHNKLPWAQKYPGILGHESVGVVVEVGSKVKNFKVGDMVIRPTPAYPGTTYHGYTSLWGGFSELGLVTDAAAIKADGADVEVNGYVQYQLKVPESLGLSAADAAQLITLKEVTGYASSLGVTLNTPVLLLGGGSVAYAFCKGIKYIGGHPLIVAARRDEQLEVASRLGADYTINVTRDDLAGAVKCLTNGAGVAYVIDATGSPQFLASALPALAPEGKVGPYATYPADDPIKNHIPAEKIGTGQTGEVATHGFFCSLVRHGMLRLDDLYSHKLPLRMIAEGFEMIERKEAFKIVFEM
ncbi:MAG: zinc-binding dehydrogenase [Lentisphaerae bacterium]|mgnify:FL=1|jgi:threonine dehydrogenase-like Zn-dependent dehydrogenase|nr:zinc-binding dehydrogenase [Lentisphaerota bacterium]